MSHFLRGQQAKILTNTNKATGSLNVLTIPRCTLLALTYYTYITKFNRGRVLINWTLRISRHEYFVITCPNLRINERKIGCPLSPKINKNFVYVFKPAKFNIQIDITFEGPDPPLMATWKFDIITVIIRIKTVLTGKSFLFYTQLGVRIILHDNIQWTETNSDTKRLTVLRIEQPNNEQNKGSKPNHQNTFKKLLQLQTRNKRKLNWN